jgi:hypothetical protein
MHDAGFQLQSNVMGALMPVLVDEMEKSRARKRGVPLGENGANGGGGQTKKGRGFQQKAYDQICEITYLMNNRDEQEAKFRRECLDIQRRSVHAQEMEAIAHEKGAEARLLEAKTHEKEVQLRMDEHQERMKEKEAEHEERNLMMELLKQKIAEAKKNGYQIA